MTAPIILNDDAPAVSAVAITPSDSTDFTSLYSRALWIGNGGTVKVDMADGTTVTFEGCPTGSVLPIRCRRVYSTGTSATSILALF